MTGAVLLEVVFVVLLAFHLICVNVGTAGPLVCLWLEWREGRGDSLAGRAGRFLAATSLLLLFVGIAVGLILGWMRWTPAYADVLLRLGSRITFGVWELVFSLALMAPYVIWWNWQRNPSLWQRALRPFLPLLAGTNLLYHFPFLFVIIVQLADDGSSNGRSVTSADFRQLMINGDVLAQTIHFWMASFAVTGMVLIGYAWKNSDHSAGKGNEQDDASRVAVWGGRIALIPTLLQIPIGMWVLLQLPDDAKRRLMGGDLLGTTFLCVSLAAALWLMHQLAAAAMGNVSRSSLMRCMIAMTLVILLMTGTLRSSRPSRGDDSNDAAQNTIDEVQQWR